MRAKQLTECLLLTLASALVQVTPLGAQDDIHTATKRMPKPEQEMVEKFASLVKDRQSALRIADPLARQDALGKADTNQQQWLTELNKGLSTDGARDWVGLANVNDDSLSIVNTVRLDNTRRNILNVEIVVSYGSLSKEVRTAIRKLKRGEMVKFTIESDEKRKLKFQTSGPITLRATVSGKLLTEISPYRPD
jgi:hypothetical protein